MNQIRSRLADLVRQHRARMNDAGMHAGSGGATGGHLTELTGFGANPGALRMLAFLPDLLPPGAPLVVALHGCTQTAAGYDHGSGWSALAQAGGFASPEAYRADHCTRLSLPHPQPS